MVALCYLGIIGGCLFHYWVTFGGSYNARRLARTISTKTRRNEDIINDNQTMMQTEGEAFLIFVLSTLNHRGAAATRQIFYICLQKECHSLELR